MHSRQELIRRWKTDEDFKTIASAAGSFAVTLLFALYNGFLGIAHVSVWHGTICVYYLVLTVLRGYILVSERKRGTAGETENRRKKAYMCASLGLLGLNLSLLAPVSLLTLQQKPVHLTLIPAVTMAAYTTVKVTVASVNLKRRKALRNQLAKLLRTVSFIDAMVSVLTLQNTLIMVSVTGGDRSMLRLTAITSGIIMLAVLLLSIAALVNGNRSEKK